MDSFILNRIPMLKPDNWLSWKWKLEISLKCLNLWPFENNKNVDWSTNDDLLVQTIISLSIDDSITPIIMECSTAQEMWTNLCKHFNNCNIIKQNWKTNTYSKFPNKSSKINFMDNRFSLNITQDFTKYQQQTSVKESQYNLLKDDDNLDEIMLYLKDSTNNLPNDEYALLENEPFYDQVKDLSLWPQLLILQPSYLAKLKKFYYKNGIFLLFDNNGKIYKTYCNLEGRFKTIDYKFEELVDLQNQDVVSVVQSKRGSLFLLTKENFLYGMGDNLHGQLGVGNRQKQILPVFVAKDIKKVACGYSHTLILDINGNLLTCGELFPDKNESKIKPSLVRYFIDIQIVDIACCYNASIVLTTENEVYVWGKFNCTIYSPMLVKLDFFVTSIVGGKTQFVVVSDYNTAYICYNNADRQINKIKVNIDQPIQRCFNDMFEDNFIFLKEDETCSIFKKNSNGNEYIHTSLKSISDFVSLYSTPQTPVLTIVPSEFTKDLETLSPLNNPTKSDITFMIEKKLIFAHRYLLNKSNYFKQQLSSEWKSQKYPITIKRYSYATFYYYLQFIYSGNIEPYCYQNLLPELKKLAQDYDDKAFLDSL